MNLAIKSTVTVTSLACGLGALACAATPRDGGQVGPQSNGPKLSSPTSVAAAAAPYTLIEAESAPRGAVKSDPGAHGGKYVAAPDGAYQPLVIAPVPATGGDAFIVWVRTRGVSAQLKGTPGGGQKGYAWLHDRPESFAWRRFGAYTREQLGARVVVIRGPKGEKEGGDAGIDAILFAADAAFDPARDLPLSAPSPVTVAVDWGKRAGRVTPVQYGMNLYKGFDPASPDNAAYRENLAYMGPGLVRFHQGGAMGDSAKSWAGLLDYEKRTWDAAKVKKVLALRLAHAPEKLVNIPGWPAWMDADNDRRLDRDQFDAYARLLADLVRIANVDAGLGIRWWEITNEEDDRYYKEFHSGNGSGPLKDPAKPDKLDELIDIYNRCAVAMKKVDPSIKTGGPAAARPDLAEMHERFARGTFADLDFFSFHAYASGSAETPDKDVYGRADLSGRYVKQAVEMLRRVSPARPIPVMLGEYNISWTWETRDPRMTNHKGAVYDALVLVRGMEAGAFSTQAWNEKDGVYGKTTPDDKRRPGADLFHLFNRYLVGERASAASTDALAVVPYAVADPKGKRRSLLLVNRTDAVQEARLSGAAPAGPYRRHEVGAAGYFSRAEATPGATSWKLPPHSVTVLVWGEGSADAPKATAKR